LGGRSETSMMTTNNEPLVHLNYPIDLNRILESAARAKIESKPYTDSRYPELLLDQWHIGKYTDEYIESIISDFEVEGRPRFYWLEPYATIPEHVDNETQCSINLIITDDPAPITINGTDFVYRQALLDTTVPHSVVNSDKQRIMLKISIFNETFDQLSQRIKYKND
jgi:hypothetical protein